MLKVRTFYIGLSPLTGKAATVYKAKWRTDQTGISCRQRSAISVRPFENERTLDPESAAIGCRYSMPQPTALCYGIHPAMFSGNDALSLVGSFTM